MFLREDKDNSKPYVGHVVHKHIWLYFTILNSDHLFWVFNPELDRHLSLISVRFDTSKNCKCYCYPLGGGKNRILRRNITFIINWKLSDSLRSTVSVLVIIIVSVTICRYEYNDKSKYMKYNMSGLSLVILINVISELFWSLMGVNYRCAILLKMYRHIENNEVEI